MKLKSTHLTSQYHNHLIRLDQVGKSLWMFSVLTLQSLELTNGQGFLTSDSAEEAAKNAIEELLMEKTPLETIEYRHHRIEVYPARQKRRFKSIVFDLAQRRKFFSELCKSIDSAIALAKNWIDSEGHKC